ncbi:MAG: DUF3598 domain-containing protein [Microcoleaceae cyanobacterium MO_207.B10]|nr:DUF3598 domain-containing protein [Microcoleaceae cyanobacterium MO_207.B10]
MIYQSGVVIMSNIREEMPVLYRHQGDWKGTYTVIDNEGNIIDKHNCHLTCQFPESGEYPYFQTNRYDWADGKKEEYQFPGIYRDKKIWFDTERLDGYAWEVDDSTIILWITYKGMADFYIYEMINISPDNNHRARTWHWFQNDKIVKRTIIKEERVS